MRQPLLITQEPPSCFQAFPSFGWFLLLVFLSSIHPSPTLVSHPCLSSSARPLSHSFWRFVSCCGPHRPVQGSHPHQMGLGCQLCVFNTKVTAFPRAASPPIPLWLTHMAWNLFYDPQVDVLGRRSAFFSHDFGLPRTTLWQFGFPSLVPGHFFLLGMGLGLEMEWAETSRTFWPHDSPSKSCYPAPRAGRRILTFSGLSHGRLSLVSLRCQGFFGYP